jgi:hypothetical protein
MPTHRARLLDVCALLEEQLDARQMACVMRV